MKRAFWITVLSATTATATVGCQATKNLFAGKDVPPGIQLVDADELDTTVAAQNVDESTDVQDLLDKADRDLAAKRYAEAQTNYQAALRKAPASAHAHHRLAVIADLEERFADAEEHYQAALVRDGRNSQILSDMGYSYILQGRIADAESRLNQARAADPSNMNAAANLALLYAHQGDRDKCTAVARLLGSGDQVEQTVDALFAQAGTTAMPTATPEIQQAGAFDFFKRDKNVETAELQTPANTPPPGVNQLTYELKQKMDAARAESLRLRQQRQSNDPRRQIPPTGEILGVRGVAPYDINSVLAEIDRQTPRANQLPSLMADPRVQAVGPQRPANEFGPQQPTNDIVTADATQPMTASNPAVIGTNGFAQQSTAAPLPNTPWPQTQNVAPAQNTAQPFNQQGRYQTQPGMVQPAISTTPMASSPYTQPPAQAMSYGQNTIQPMQQQTPDAQAMEAARQRAAAVGMGAGLGGMFDRYAYKQQQNAAPQLPATQAQTATTPQNAWPQQQQPAAAMPNLTSPQTSAALQRPQAAPGQTSPSYDPRQFATTQQAWPGTGSQFGAQYPPVQRQLPTDRPSTPPTITAGMPAAPNWQGQTLPSSTPQLSGPAEFGTITPNGALAPTPPSTSFGPPVMQTQQLPTADALRSTVNSEFNQLRRQMAGTPNIVPPQGPVVGVGATGAPSSSPTNGGPWNPNVPYYGQTVAPRAGTPAAQQRLPQGFVQPPPYNGGLGPQQSPVPSTQRGASQSTQRVVPQSTITPAAPPTAASLPEITPRYQ